MVFSDTSSDSLKYTQNSIYLAPYGRQLSKLAKSPSKTESPYPQESRSPDRGSINRPMHTLWRCRLRPELPQAKERGKRIGTEVTTTARREGLGRGVHVRHDVTDGDNDYN